MVVNGEFDPERRPRQRRPGCLDAALDLRHQSRLRPERSGPDREGVMLDIFELRRQSDALVHTFVRTIGPAGSAAYKRQDGDFWITKREGWGWVAWDDADGTCLGRP